MDDDDDDFIPFNISTNDYKFTLSSEQLTFINRASCEYEPVELQLKN